MREKNSRICKSREFKVVPSPRSRQVLTQYFFFPPSFFSFFTFTFLCFPLSNFLRPSLNFLAVCLGKLTMEGKAKEGKGFFALSFFHSFPLPSPMGAVRNDGPARNKVGGGKQNWPALQARQIAGNLFTFPHESFYFYFYFPPFLFSSARVCGKLGAMICAIFSLPLLLLPLLPLPHFFAGDINPFFPQYIFSLRRFTRFIFFLARGKEGKGRVVCVCSMLTGGRGGGGGGGGSLWGCRRRRKIGRRTHPLSSFSSSSPPRDDMR